MSDQRVPEQSDSVSVFINVVRDNFAPVFLSQNYSITIVESTAVSTSIIKVQAEDRDLSVSKNILFCT